MKKLLHLAAIIVAIMLSLVACDKTENGNDSNEPFPDLEKVNATYSAEKNSIVIKFGDYVTITVTPEFKDSVCTSYSMVQVWAKESWARQAMEKDPQQYAGATRKGNTITATYSQDVLELGLIGMSQSDYNDYLDALNKTGGKDQGGKDEGGKDEGGKDQGGKDEGGNVSYEVPATMNFGGKYLISVQGIEDFYGRRLDNYGIAFGASLSQSGGKTLFDYIIMNYGSEYTVRSASPLVFMSDSTTYPYSSYTDKYSLTLNAGGYVTEFSCNDTQEVGKITYNGNGMIETAKWERKYNNECGDQEVNATYSFSYDGETLTGVTAQVNTKETYDEVEEEQSFGLDIQFGYPESDINNVTRQQIPIVAKIIGGYMDSYEDIVSRTASRFAMLGYFGKGSDILPNEISITKIWQYQEGNEEETSEMNIDYTFRENGALNTVSTYYPAEEEEEEEEEEDRNYDSAYEFSYYGDEED